MEPNNINVVAAYLNYIFVYDKSLLAINYIVKLYKRETMEWFGLFLCLVFVLFIFVIFVTICGLLILRSVVGESLLIQITVFRTQCDFCFSNYFHDLYKSSLVPMFTLIKKRHLMMDFEYAKISLWPSLI